MSAFLLKNPDCVFIHIPKTAGTSIRKGVWNREYQGPYFGKIPEHLKDHFKFAFVRNPYDRLKSVWRMFAAGTSDTVRSDDMPWTPNPDLTIDDVLDIVENGSIDYGAKRSTVEERIKHHALPMTHPFNLLDKADFVGRYESLHEDWKIVCVKVGIPCKPLPKRHVARKIRYTYTEEQILRINRVYSEDFTKLKYGKIN